MQDNINEDRNKRRHSPEQNSEEMRKHKKFDRNGSTTNGNSSNFADKTGLIPYIKKDVMIQQKIIMTPQLQKPAPEFSGTAVINGEFKPLKLSDYKNKYVVLFFYPLDFTFVCPTEIIAFSDRAKEFRAIDVEIIGCSTDSHFTHLAWINTSRKEGGLGSLDIPLLADKSMKIARDYGVLNEETGIPFRGLFIIDGKQVLRQITVNDLPVGRSVDEVLRLVQAFKFTDEHGEVCPANWKPGAKTIVPDTDKSKAFFKASD